MRKVLAVLLLSMVVFFAGSCLKGSVCEPKTVEDEQAQITAFATANGISGSFHPSGLYYQITNPGTGNTPVYNSRVSVRYTGKLLNGTIFDAQTSAPLAFTLGTVIPGWQIGLPLIQKGGTMKLIIPSSLAYGCQGIGSIPANAVLYFDVELVDVQ